jgi:hypothetical protein
MRLTVALLLTLSCAHADGPGKIYGKYVREDFTLSTDPSAAPWKAAKPVIADNDPFGKLVPNHRTEIRAVWTDANLYLLYTCPYEQLYLVPNATPDKETNKLWDYDVAEVFVGTDFQNVRRYKELQVAPAGEWVDLDIDRDHPKPEGGWRWNSGFEVKASIDKANKVWYGAMRIPFKEIDTRAALPGNELRINFYRMQGPPPDRKEIAWQPTNSPSYHVPEAFGRLVLAK